MACFRLGMSIPQPHGHTIIHDKSNNLFMIIVIYVLILTYSLTNFHILNLEIERCYTFIS